MRKGVKILGIVATVIGAGASLLAAWTSEQEMHEYVDEQINKALPETTEETENEDEDE